MRKEIFNIAIVIVLFMITCTCIDWNKEAVKACITGGVFSVWVTLLVKKHWMK